ncbi:MAG: hypothetical protein CML29_17440 [Rhizobiales bacterium]|nr:hypothetical protein [Hyphomicrobiales bacterium]MBA68634.1 hypothetical protein [Hyphomicrobiales bacterium]|tara:strand:+ start:400 stop:663 length:264 start_codon:yes stop_codon:yes gene_type:complete
MATVKIDGATVDMDDPCALYQALYAIKLKRLSGAAIEEGEIQSPVTRRRMRYGTIPMDLLEAELDRLATACDAKNGKRRRGAATFHF